MGDGTPNGQPTGNARTSPPPGAWRRRRTPQARDAKCRRLPTSHHPPARRPLLLPPAPARPPSRCACAGAQHACALLDDGTVSCWGSNQYGAVGVANGRTDVIGSQDDADMMVAQGLTRVDLGPGAVATAVTCGASTTCAVLQGGLLK